MSNKEGKMIVMRLLTLTVGMRYETSREERLYAKVRQQICNTIESEFKQT